MKTLRIVLMVTAVMVFACATAFADAAQDAANAQALVEAQTGAILFSAYYLKFLAAAFAIAIAAFGCALAMGRTTSAAYEAVSRNPSVGSRIQTLMILGLALIESLTIYAFVIAILILLRS